MHILLFIVCCIATLFMRSAAVHEDVCFLGTTELVINRVFVNDDTGITMYCTGRVIVNKCEGLCFTTATPSRRNGFKLERSCKCCRETTRTTKQVQLDTCFEDENQMTRMAGVTHSLYVEEPKTCACQQCGI
ncbi:partner of bursicon-like [Saccoglossus kowalevskii]